jgi:hypothetical protein
MPHNPLERRSHVFAAATLVSQLTWGALALAGAMIIAVVIVAMQRPDAIPTVLPVITGIGMPLIIGLMALTQKFFATVTDGQLGQLLHAVQEKEYAKGKLEGITEEAPKIVKGEP